MTPRVYSYTRFSTPEQALGDSERRQIEAAQAFARSNGSVLDETLCMVDRGLSGYRAKHKTKGVFGPFLEKVQAGIVPKGSILVVENVDRVSREPVGDAIETIVVGLLNRGITIEMLSPRFTFTKDSLSTGGIWPLMAYMVMAYDESKKKAERVSAAWAAKRARASVNGELLTAMAPEWLRIEKTPSGSRTFAIIPEAAVTIRRIFELKLAGHGKNNIARQLNADAAWTPAQKNGKQAGWCGTYIQLILRTRAVIGEFTPHRYVDGKRVPACEPIADYFPSIVPSKLFHAVQERIAMNHGTGGAAKQMNNVLRGLCRCGYCGGPVHYIDSNAQRTQDYSYLRCDKGRRALGCTKLGFRYVEVEALVLDNLSKLRPEMVLPNTSEQAAQANALRESLAGTAGQLADIEAQVTNLVAQIAKTSNPAMQTRYERMATELEAKRPELDADRARMEKALCELERGSESFAKWQKDLTGLKRTIQGDVDARIKLNAHLRTLIDRIEVFVEGDDDSVEHAEELIHDQLPDVTKAKSWPAFRRYIKERLRSRDGRFVRVHLKGQRERVAGRKCEPTGVQLAPAGSVAWGVEVRGKDMQFRGPDIGALANAFFKRGTLNPKANP